MDDLPEAYSVGLTPLAARLEADLGGRQRVLI